MESERPAAASESRELDAVDLSSLVRGLLRYRRSIALLTLLGAIAGLAGSLTRPNRFESEGKILVRFGLRERRTPEGAVGASLDVLGPAPGIADEIELLHNPVVFERMARLIGPDELLAPYDPTRWDSEHTPLPLRYLHRIQTWMQRRMTMPSAESSPERIVLDAAILIESSLQLYSERGSNILRVVATAHDPDLARRMVDAFLEVAEARHREVYDPREQLSFVAARQAELAERSAAAEEALRVHWERCGATARTVIEQRIGGTEEWLRGERVKLENARSEVAFLEEELARTTDQVQEPSAATHAQSQERARLLDELGRTESERAALLVRYPERSPLIVGRVGSLDERIAGLRASLEEAPLRVEAARAVPNPRTRMEERRAELGWEVRGLENSVAMGMSELEGLRGALQRSLECEPVHQELEQVALSARKETQEVGAALSLAEALTRLDEEERLGSLRVVQAARMPLTKAGPDRKRDVALGLIAGLVLGLGQALLRRTMDPTIHDPHRIAGTLGIPLLAVLREDRELRRGLRGSAGREPAP